jgi:iron complex outermembrane receptor protein
MAKEESMKRMVSVLVMGSLLCLFGHGVWAGNEANKTVDLQEMTVTAERFPVKEKESSQYVEIYSARELQRTGGNSVIDALRRIGGISYESYAPLGVKAGMGSKLSIRGVEDGELILINGMPIQNVGNRDYDLYNIPLESIEQIEIIKGASSTQYGSDAMSGVINIITKKNVRKKEIALSTQFGDYRYHNHNLQYLSPHVNIGLNYQHLNPMKYIQRDYEDEEYNNSKEFDRYSVNINANVFENFYFDFLGTTEDSGYEEYDAVDHQIEESDHQEQDEFFTDLRYEVENLRIKTFFKYEEEDSKEYDYDPFKEFDEKDEIDYFNTGLSADYQFDILTTETQIGMDYIRRTADFKSKYGYHYRDDYAVFAIISKKFFDRLKVNLGVREQFIEADSDGEDEDEFTPSFGINYELNKYLNLFGNAAKAFRVPTFSNLYYDSWLLQGNPDLSPEEGWTYEGGIKFDNSFSKIRLSGFYMDYEDKIDSYKPTGKYPYVYFNAGDYESVGVDWNIELTPFVALDHFVRNITFYAAGTWCDPTAEEPDGREYQTGPKFDSSVGAEYFTKTFVLGLHSHFASSRPDDLDTISTLDITGKYKLPLGFLTFAVDNVFDEDVEVNGNKETDNYVYYGMPRLFKIGYEIHFSVGG